MRLELLIAEKEATSWENTDGSGGRESRSLSPAFLHRLSPLVRGTILNVAPHMHLLGREIRLDLIRPNGEVQPLIYIDDWDFEWQDLYTFKQPISIPSFSRLQLTAIYDNSASNPYNPNNPPKPVRWGPKTTDEMCLALIGFTLE